MVQRLTIEEIRARQGRRPYSEMTTAEKAVRLTETLARLRETIARQERVTAELQRRLDPNAPKPPKLGLTTLEEVRAWVDDFIDGSQSGSSGGLR